jgi:hypothetical protein
MDSDLSEAVQGAPPKRSRGGQPGGENAMRHGLRAGKLPRGAKHIEIRLNAFRRYLEDAIIEAKGEVSIPDACHILTALRWERHACLAHRWLNQGFDSMEPTERLKAELNVSMANSTSCFASSTSLR